MIQTMVDRFRSRQLERYFMVTLFFAALGAVAISLMIGLGQSIWFDEAYSVFVAKHQLIDIVKLTSLDAHPPFYYLLLKGWAALFGWGELALRSLSALMLGGVVVVGGLLLRRMFGVRVALIALPFIALSPLLLRYGFEVRMYMLAGLIGILATYVLVAATEAKTKSRQWKLYAVYALLAALGMYTLYYMALLWLAHLVWLARNGARDKRPFYKMPGVVALAGSAALFVPWVPAFVSQIGQGDASSTMQAMTIDGIVGLVSFGFLYQPVWQLSGAGTILVVFVVATLGVLITGAFKKASKKEANYLWLLALYLLVPIVLVALISLVLPVYNERFIVPMVAGAVLLVGVAAAYGLKLASPRMQLAIGAVCVVLLLGVGQLAKVGNYNFQRLQTPAVAKAAALITDCDRDTVVLAANPYVAIELSYYLPSCEIRFYSEADELKGGYAALSDSPLRIAQPELQLANSSKLYYVYYDKAQLTMPHNLVKASHDSFEAINVDTFVSE